jgi:hypothetical protein
MEALSVRQLERQVGRYGKHSRQASFGTWPKFWSEHGRGAMQQTARTQPSTLLAIAATLIPQQVAVDLQASLPGDLSMDDWQTMKEVIAAVRRALPDAASALPGAVLEHVLSAEAKTIE